MVMKSQYAEFIRNSRTRYNVIAPLEVQYGVAEFLAETI